jgi:predicted dehydrogenase
LHASQTIAALEAGLNVMVEKPMAMSAVEAQKMNAVSEESDGILMVGHCWRFDEEVLWLREQVNSGKIGRVIRTKGYGVHSNEGPAGWFTEKELAGGGALVDMGIHAIDTARFLLGDPTPVSVYARIGTFYKDFDVDDTGVLLVEWENNVISYIESGWWQPHMDGPEASTQLYGTIGFGEVFPTRIKIANEVIDPGFTFPREDHCPQEMYDSQLRYFCQCIREGISPNPGGSEGLVNMRILDAAYESARIGKEVEISEMSGVK